MQLASDASKQVGVWGQQAMLTSEPCTPECEERCDRSQRAKQAALACTWEPAGFGICAPFCSKSLASRSWPELKGGCDLLYKPPSRGTVIHVIGHLVQGLNQLQSTDTTTTPVVGVPP